MVSLGVIPARLVVGVALAVTLSVGNAAADAAEPVLGSAATVATGQSDTPGSVEPPDMLDAGTVILPAANPRPRRPSSAPHAEPDPYVDLDAVKVGAQPVTLTVPAVTSALPYGGWTTCPTSAQEKAVGQAVNADGVRLFTFAGKTWEHPVMQAQIGLNCIYSYLAGKRDQYRLDRARANADHLLSYAVADRGTIYFPYGFDFAVNGNTEYVSKAPWYSAMAQGQALSLFVALYNIATDPDEKQKWQDAADLTAESLLIAPQNGRPSVTFVDKGGYLWFEEYAGSTIPDGERVLNGHLFAMFGLYDHWRTASSPSYRETSSRITEESDLDLHRQFLGAALETALHYIPVGFRNPAGANFYSLGNHALAATYQRVHTDQFLRIHALTGDPRWADHATQFQVDYPASEVSGINFQAGSHTLYRRNQAGEISETKAVTFARATWAPTDDRRRVLGALVINRISAGAYTGWWVAEVPGRTGTSTLVGATTTLVRRTFYVVGNMSFTAYQANADGTLGGGLTIKTAKASLAHFSEIRYRWNVPYLKVIDGSWAGRWIPLGPGLTTDVPVGNFVVNPGAHTAIRFDATGAAVTSSAKTITRPSGAAYTDQIMRGNQIFIHVSNGIWADMWLPVTKGVSLG